MVNNGVEYFYDLGKIKDTGHKVVDETSKPIKASVSSDTNVSQNNENVKASISKGLDNSSFSLEEQLEKYVYPKQVYEHFKNEDKSKITKSIAELQKYKETLDTDTDEGMVTIIYSDAEKQKMLEFVEKLFSKDYNAEYQFRMHNKDKSTYNASEIISSWNDNYKTYLKN